MDFVRAVVLGIVQALTEFLPVSSSGHLILVPRLFNWPDQGLAFDVGLHMGTLVALLGYFWRDWLRMFRAALGDLRGHGPRVGRWSPQGALLPLIAIGSIPAALVGFLLDDWIEEHVRQPWLVAIMLIVFGGTMLLAERISRRDRGLDSVRLVDVLLIGAAQAVALIPGVSRSGATMSMGMARHLDREAAGRFAFLLGTPAFVGAGLLKLGDLEGSTGREFAELGLGFLMAAAVGYAVIHYLLRFLRTRSLLPFVYYRWAVAVLTLVIGAIRVA